MAENTSVPFSDKKSKDNVNYRVQYCGICDNFEAGKCRLVEGGIASEAQCNLWSMRQMPQGKDAEFYKSEYDKAHKVS
jgi:hypothetical protein